MTRTIGKQSSILELSKLLSLIFFVLFTQISASQEGSVNTPTLGTAGEFELKNEDGHTRQALLLNTDVSGSVNGMIAQIRLNQTFENDSDQWSHGRYVFPLPENAAVDSLRITIGERVIKGEIKQKEVAKKIFERAKKQGKKAALLNQHRPNIFSLSVANIEPGRSISVSLTYTQLIHYDQHVFELRLPTTLTPRYIPGTPLAAAVIEEIGSKQEIILDQHGWAANTDSVPDASLISPPQEHAELSDSSNEKNNQTFSLEIELNPGLSLDQIESQSHLINQQALDAQRHRITLQNGREKMNRDFIVRWKPTPGAAPKAALFQQTLGEENYAMLMFVPPNINTSSALPRNVTFIVDSSGSMAGDSMQAAKQSLRVALNQLTQNDRFNLIDFDSRFVALFPHNQPALNRSIAQAHAMIDSMVADGGTEMMSALEFALDQPQDETALNQIVFITDGSIGNEAQLFELINRKLGSRRLFTVGIGSAPNSYFMRKAAKFGRGTYTYVDSRNISSNLADSPMATLFSKLTRPILRDIKVDWNTPVEAYPEKLPDLYADEPLLVFSQSKTPLKQLSISGTLLNTGWQRNIHASRTQAPQDIDKKLGTLWARQKIEHLMDQLAVQELKEEEVKPLVVALGEQHQIVSKYTSFVAVEQRVSRPRNETAKNSKVSNLMPHGSTMPVPQTASLASRFIVVGILILLLGLASRRRLLPSLNLGVHHA